jgi:restriction system-associated AAA family ATPase
MKLIRLKIKDELGFRSLQKDTEVYFLRDFDYDKAHEFNPNILAGRNGSGKSNILEALSNIFYHIDCIYSDNLPDNFSKKTNAKEDEEDRIEKLSHEKKFESEEEDNDIENNYVFDNTICAVNEFELEYFIPIPIVLMDKPISELPKIPINQIKARVLITKVKEQAPTIEWVNRYEYSNSTGSLGKKIIQQLLPTYVLGYSSGENELLSLPFFKTRFLHFDEYLSKLTMDEDYGFPPKPEGRLVYLDNQFSQAILLANLLMQDDNSLKPFAEHVELENIDQFRLIICQDRLIELNEAFLKGKKTTIEEKHEDHFGLVELTSKLKKSIDRLKKCATCFENRYISIENREEGREYLVLDYKVNKATKEAFQFHFSEKPLELFQLFQILLELNAYVVSEEDKRRVYESNNIFINHDVYPMPLEEDRILRFKYLYVKKKGVDSPLFTKQLSDGEHQFLHTLGLCMLFKNENCLYLLDEPETHFNPDWKSEFISNIRHCFDNEKNTSVSEMLITTHSPYLISDSDDSNVIVFRKEEETNLVSNSRPDFKTYGASVNKLTLKIFDKNETIGDFANADILKYYERMENGEDPNILIDEAENKFGDSVEKIILINSLMEKIK